MPEPRTRVLLQSSLNRCLRCCDAVALLGGSALLRMNFMVDLKINSGTKEREEGKRSHLWCVPAL